MRPMIETRFWKLKALLGRGFTYNITTDERFCGEFTEEETGNFDDYIVSEWKLSPDLTTVYTYKKNRTVSVKLTKSSQ